MRRPGPVLAALACAALSACAPGAAREGGAGPAIRVVPTFPGAEIFQTSDARPVVTVVPAPVDSAWQALVAAYRELGVATPALDAAHHLLGNEALSVQGRLGSQRLPVYFNCGTGLTGEVAATARLRVNIFSELVAHPDGALLRTLVQATASNPQGASADPVLCSSTGRLENALATAVQLRSLRRD